MRLLLPALLFAAVLAPTAPATPVERRDTSIRSHLVAHRTTIGDPVRIVGRVNGPRRRLVRAQVRVEGGWRTVDTTRTNNRRRFRLHTDSWYGLHRYRVLAPATRRHARDTRYLGKLRVRAGYSAKGRPRHYSLVAGPEPHWNPCEPIRWQWNPRGGYSGSLRDVRRSLRTIAQASGLRFSYQGRSRRIAYRNDTFTDPGRDADLLISWATPRQVPRLEGPTAGLGGFSYYDDEIAKGNIALDASVSHSHSRAVWRQTMLHEAGHVLGLGHTDRRDQLMYGSAHAGNRLLGTGDLTGIRRLGAARACQPDSARR